MLKRLQITSEQQQMLRRLSWLAVLFVAAGVVISAVEKKEESIAQDLSIKIEPLENGESFLKEEDVRLAIERSFGYKLEGRTLASIDVDRLERTLEEDPFILNADAYVGANTRVKVKIEQREPILRVMDNNKLNYYLDRNGVKMPPSPHFTAKVLVVTGNLPPHEPGFLERKRNSLKDAFRLTEMILADEFLKAMIEQLHVTNRGEITLVPMVGNQKIIFGKFEQAADKLRYLKTFYEEVAPRENWRKYSEIDLQYKGQIVCKR